MEEREPTECERSQHRSPEERYSPQPVGVSGADGLPQQVAEYRDGVVELHLLVVEGQREEDRAGDVVVCCHSDDGPEDQSEADTVVLEVSVVDHDQGWVEQEEEEEGGLWVEVDTCVSVD